MELMKMYSVMDQVANAGALTMREKKYLKQGLKIKSSALNRVSMTCRNNLFYYPTALRKVQKTPKTSTNITRYLYSRGPVRQVSCR